MKNPIQYLEQLTFNPFQNLFHIKYKDRLDQDRDYYFCSHNDKDHLGTVTHALIPEGVCVYAITEEEEPRLVLIKEYRIPLDQEIYACPAGRIDPGEEEHVAAKREMLEETGLTFKEYTGGFAGFRRPFYLVPGVSDEANCTIYGTVDISQVEQQPEATEWIEVLYATKEEVRRILLEERVDIRASFLMMQFLQSEKENPFAFLH